MLVSSTKSIASEDSLTMDERSFKYKLNSEGPSTDSCGTPHLTTSQ
jgi:hypothetical protein